jgi:hypothetical protein
MLLGPLFEPFVASRPICVMARGVLERLLDPERIDELFDETAERQYTRDLLFSTLVGLMGDVVLGVQPSVHAAYQARRDEVGVSTTAVYNKLDRVETGISAALVGESAREAGLLIDALKARMEPWVPGYRCRVLDGNHLSATEHRIEELRHTWAAPLPGKLLVVLDPERMLIDEVFLTEDGHAQERRLLGEVLETVQADDLWIADRNICTFNFMSTVAASNAFFLIRQHGQYNPCLSGKRRKIGDSETGVVYEQSARLIDQPSGAELKVRRITVALKEKTRDGYEEIHILTNLPTKAADAVTLSDVYRKRWTIESVFLELTTTLNCEIQTLGYPPAALFAFCLAVLAWNAVSVLKASLRAVHGEQTVRENVSGYYLALEIWQTWDGMQIAIPDECWRPLRALTATEMAQVLRQVAGHVNLSRYQKHPRGPKKKPPPKDKYKPGGHVSTAKLLSKRREPC